MNRTRLSPCATAVRRADPDRYLCALFAPAEARETLFALYAFNVEIATARESIRETVLGRMRLQWWRDMLVDVRRGRTVEHPVAESLAVAMRRSPLTFDLFDRLLTGRERDFDDAPPASIAALVDYADLTSASLVCLALEALEVSHSAAFEAARHVGIAWALVGLMRAIPFHARAGRAYLPRDLMARHGVSSAALFTGAAPGGLANVSRELTELAVTHLHDARALRPDIPCRASSALLTAAFADGDIKRLRRAAYDPFHPSLARRGFFRQWPVVRRGFSAGF